MTRACLAVVWLRQVWGDGGLGGALFALSAMEFCAIGAVELARWRRCGSPDYSLLA